MDPGWESYEHLVEEMISFNWGILWSWDLGLLELSGMRMLTRLTEISVLSYLTLTGMGNILFRL